MERHRCKLCSKNFSNGRALGGHMRSHLFNLPICEEMPAEESERKPVYHAESASSASSFSSSSSEEDEGDVKDQGYGLRENPKKSVRLGDPEFSFAGSVVLQDRGSETESSKSPTRRRSKRIQNSSPPPPPPDSKEKIKLSNFSSRVEGSCHRVELEQGSSSISDATTEEDVAFCLMMLSRDKWKRQKRTKEAKFVADQDLGVEEKEGEEEEGEEEEDEQDEETDESEGLENCKVTANNKNYKSRGKHRCETCKKTFRSYQALGGHRASHKKAQQLLPPPPLLAVQLAAHESAPTTTTARGDSAKVHKCPYCSRIFSSGQALGGHKRSHTANSGTSTTVPFPGKKSGDALIDLNLPAPVDDDDLVELSAVSDAEYLYHMTR